MASEVNRLAGGCGGETVGTISGRVTFEGRPLAESIVSFVTAKGRVVTGRLDKGKYVAEAVPVGPARITVRQIADPFAKESKASRGKENPPRYRSADHSGLKNTVVRGRQTHAVELTR